MNTEAEIKSHNEKVIKTLREFLDTIVIDGNIQQDVLTNNIGFQNTLVSPDGKYHYELLFRFAGVWDFTCPKCGIVPAKLGGCSNYEDCPNKI